MSNQKQAQAGARALHGLAAKLAEVRMRRKRLLAGGASCDHPEVQALFAEGAHLARRIDDLRLGYKLPGNCLDCQYCNAVVEPNPKGWFNDDDMTAYCTRNPKPLLEREGGELERPVTVHPGRVITAMERPYQLRENCVRPEWCPLVVLYGEDPNAS